MPMTDDFPGPDIAEEVQFEDRTTDGNPTINGAVRFVSDDLVVKTAGGVKSLTAAAGGGITESQHDGLDDLVHWLAESHHLEVVRTSGKVTRVTAWTDSGKTTKVRELDNVVRSSGKISSYDLIQFDGSGTEKQRLAFSITRSSGKVASIDITETGG